MAATCISFNLGRSGHGGANFACWSWRPQQAYQLDSCPGLIFWGMPSSHNSTKDLYYLTFFLLNLTVVRSLAQPFLLRLWLQELLNGSKFTIAFLNIVLAWASFFDEKKGVQWHVHKCRIWKMGPEEKCWWRHGSATPWKLVRCTFGCQTVMWSVDVWDGQAKLLNHPRPCPARPRWGA